MLKQLNQYIYIYLIVLLLCSNFITKIIVRLTNLQLNYYPSTIIKALLICFALFFFLKLRDKKAWIYVTALLVVFFLGLLFDPENESSLKHINEKVYYFIKHIYLFLLIPILAKISKETWNKIVNVLLVFGKANVIFILFGWLFEIDLLKSYNYSTRFGYNGLLPIQGAGTFYYIFVISIAYFKGFMEYKNLNKINRSSLIDIYILILGALFLGTKGAYLFLFLILLVDIFFRQNRKRLTYFSLGSLTVLFISFRELIAVNMLKFMNLPIEIYTENGLLTTLLSYRDLLFIKAMEYIETNWQAVNYIIGGTNFTVIKKVEIEIIDIFSFFGLAGIIIYFLFIKSYLYSKKEPLLNILLILILLIGNLSGNLVSSISNTTFFAFSFLYLKNNYSFKKSN
jgi:hypothetical protein